MLFLIMKKFLWWPGFFICVSTWAIPPQDEPIVKAVEKVRPAVVNIYTEGVVTQEVRDPRDVFFERYFGGGMSRGNRILQTPLRNLGSGLIVSPDGYIVTNQHVANRETNPKIRVTLVNGKDYEAVLLRDDDLQDLALIKVATKEPLPFLGLEKLSPNMLGQTVLVLGNPVGYENSVSAGILSAKDRTLTIGDLTMEGLLQTDAAINPGNSGGPLVDGEGNLVGLSRQDVDRPKSSGGKHRLCHSGGTGEALGGGGDRRRGGKDQAAAGALGRSGPEGKIRI